MKLYTHRYNSSMEIVRDSLTIGGDPDNWIKKVRHADEYYMQCGMLSGIEHPTGAKETFVWEANKARIEDRFYDTEIVRSESLMNWKERMGYIQWED